MATTEDGWSEDAKPDNAAKKPGTKSAAKKRTAQKRTGTTRGAKSATIPLAVQLELPYLILGDVVGRKLPSTGGALKQQAPQCAQAWDQFLLRYPSLREKLEQGMVAGDVVALLMAHMPIIQMAREESAWMAQQRAQQQGYDGGIGPEPDAAAA